MLHWRNNASRYGNNFINFINDNKYNKGIKELRNTFKDDKSFLNYMQNFAQATPEETFKASEKGGPEAYYARQGTKLKITTS